MLKNQFSEKCMPKQSRISLARAEISSYFSSKAQTVYSAPELESILETNRKYWKLPKSMQLWNFASSLCEHTKLKPVQLQSVEYHRQVKRFAWGEPSPLELAQSMSSKGYLSHGSASALHGLTTHSTNTVYLNIEQSSKLKNSGSLVQQSIDLAFSRKQRQSSLIYKHLFTSIVVLTGKNTDQLGVEEKIGPEAEILRVTNLERTLIDIVVRPNYAGGPEMVLESYREAKGQMSIELMLKILQKLDYVYPYHQAIGFLMERAGYPQSAYNELKTLGLHYDFYLAHQIEKAAYCEEWRIHHPNETAFKKA
jgi:predicted transcriptional regulator of viral defense system